MIREEMERITTRRDGTDRNETRRDGSDRIGKRRNGLALNQTEWIGSEPDVTDRIKMKLIGTRQNG